MEPPALRLDKETLRTARGHRDKKLAVAAAYILEGVRSPHGDQHRITVAQVLNLARAPEAEPAGHDAEHLLLAMMHMHRRAGPNRDTLDPVGEAPTCIAGLHDNRSRQIE